LLAPTRGPRALMLWCSIGIAFCSPIDPIILCDTTALEHHAILSKT